jgi:hypothetical protein
MRMLPRKESTAENTPQEVGTGTERRVLRRTEVTVEREVLSILVPAQIEVNAEGIARIQEHAANERQSDHDRRPEGNAKRRNQA